MSVWKHKRGGWYLQLRWPSNRREQIYLGKDLSEDNARFINARVLELQKLRPLGVPLSLDTLAWVQMLSGKLFDDLLKLGLVDPKSEAKPMGLVEWCDTYLASRTDYKKSTKKGWNTARNHMESAFSDLKMHEITAFQAKQFARDLAKRASSEHASKIIERINQLYEAAIEAKKLSENPFSDVKITGKRDKSRDFYVSKATYDAVLAKCKHAHAKALFALARWCGLRVPHEPLSLKWEHIKFNELRLHVPAETKTGFRVLPLFPNALLPLQQLRSDCPIDQEYVFDRARQSAATTWRDWLVDAAKDAGREPWPKLWHNLRASCRTDLEEQFESHVCDAWIGHSHRVAKDHYLMVKPEDWERAQSGNVAHSQAHSQQRG